MSRSALVSTTRLAELLEDPDLRVLDASWYLPSAGRDPRAEFDAGHVPGARFFDIDALSAPDSALPHMLPSAEAFATGMAALGVTERHHVVLYDGAGILSAPRAWWTLRAFGHREVSVLDGGLPKWRAEGRALTDEVPTALPTGYRAKPQPNLLADLDGVRAALADAPGRILDARSRGRFEGTAPEPRPGLRGGRMPGSKNLPWTELVQEDGTLAPPDRLEALIVASGLEDGPVVTTCGSGITAATLALALYELGRSDVRVYDGSWAEWGGRDDTPVEAGPSAP